MTRSLFRGKTIRPLMLSVTSLLTAASVTSVTFAQDQPAEAEAAAAVVAEAMPAGNYEDVVHLANGARLVGEVIEVVGGKLTIATDYAGTLQVDLAKIKGVTTDQAMTIALSTGDQVTGPLTYADGKGQTVPGTAFGQVSLDWAQAEAAWVAQTMIDPRHAAELKAVSEQAEKQMEEVEARHAEAIKQVDELRGKLEPKWSARVLLGMNGKTGNTERVSFLGSAEAKRETEHDRTYLYVSGEYARQNGDRSANEVIGGIRLEVDITDRLYALGGIELEYDEFENLDLRATADAGLGYFIIRDEEQRHIWKTFLTVGYVHESFRDGMTDDKPVLTAGYDYLVDIQPWLTFNNKLKYVPSLEDFADYRLIMDTGVEIPIEMAEGWKIRVGMKNEYDSMPDAGIERLDTTYYSSLVMEFD